MFFLRSNRRCESRVSSSTKTESTVAIFESIESLETRRFFSVTVSPNITLTSLAKNSSISGYMPTEIRAAYGFDSVTLSGGVTGDGSGQTIAIVDAYNDPSILSDLKTFDKAFSLTDPKFSQVSQTGGSTSSITTDGDWSDEIALDVEWAHAAAPGANIVLVEANDDSLTNLSAAVKYATSITDVSVVSMSWGTSDFYGQTQYDSLFTTPSGHKPITFVASSGDDGAAYGPSWPSSSTNVLAVGGTTLTTTGSGAATTIVSETGWSDSGGGTSRYEAASTYQSSVTGSAARSTPDVSINANPNTGYAVYSSVVDSSGDSGWGVVGGTSAGAPQWAGLIAIADQARVLAGKATLDSATGTLPALYSALSSSTTYTADFNDIVTGSSGSSFGGFGGYGGGFGRRGPGQSRFSSSISATTGYDKVTGLGSPNASAIVATLSAAKNGKTTTTTTVTKSVVRVARAAVETVAAVNMPTPAAALHHATSNDQASSLRAMVEAELATASERFATGGGGATSFDSRLIASDVNDTTRRTVAVAANNRPGTTANQTIIERLDQPARQAEVSSLSDFFSSRRIRANEAEGNASRPSARTTSADLASAGAATLLEEHLWSNRDTAIFAGLAILTASQVAASRQAKKRAQTVEVTDDKMGDRNER